MKIAIVKDLHPLGNRLDEWRRQYQAVLDEADEAGCDAMLIAGDVFDSSNVFDAHASTGAVVDAVAAPLAEWLQGCRRDRALAIPGNHDKASDADTDALPVLEAIGVRVVRRPSWTALDAGPSGATVAVLCLPWMWTPGAGAEQAVRDLLPSRPTGCSRYILLAHVQVIGGRMSAAGRVCDHGTWAFSREFIEEMSARFDLIELGDFHAEQFYAHNAWHGPALWQQNFGESENPQGFVIYDTDTGERRLIDVNVSRRHRVDLARSVEQAMEIASTFDPETERLCIKPDGFRLPTLDANGLRARGIVVAPPVNMPRAERANRAPDIRAGDSLHNPIVVFRLWAGSRSEPFSADEQQALEHLIAEVTLDTQALANARTTGAGSGCPIDTCIEGVGGTMGSASIDWDRAGRLVCIHGDNGAGKTTITGGGFLALYDELPGYVGSMKDNLCSTGDGTGRVMHHFEYGGRQYEVERVVTATTHRAWLRKDGEEIAGPKVSDVRANVEAMLGTAEGAKATWWVSADRDNDLCGARTTPGERRTLFGQFLGFARFDALASAFGDEAKAAEKLAAAMTAELGALPDYAAQLRALAEEADVARGRCEQAEVELGRARARVEALAGELRGADGDDAQHRAAIAAHASALAALHQAELRANALKADVDRLAVEAGKLPGARFDAAKAESLAVEITSLERQLEQREARERWEGTHSTLASQRDATASRLDAARAKANLQPGDAELSARLEAIRDAGTDARAKRDQAEERNRRREADRQRVSRDRDAAIRERDQIAARLAKRQATPFGDECQAKGCAFLAEYAALPARLTTLEENIAILMAEFDAIPADEPLADLQPLRDEYARAEQARKRVEAAGAAQKEIAILEDALVSADARLAEHKRVEPVAVACPRASLRGKRADAAAVAGADVRVRAAEQATEALAGKRAAHDDALAAVGTANAAVAEAAGPKSLAEQAIADKEATRLALQQKVDEAKRVLAVAETEDRAARETRTRIEERTRTVREAEAASQDKRATLDATTLRASRLRLLQGAFGKTGIQPLLIDAAAPELEDIVNPLLDEATGGEMSVRIATQEAIGSGELRETFLILATDERGERDVSRFSGGQREKLQIVFRCGLALWLARRAGASLESLVIDEAFNKLHPSNFRVMKGVLESLSQHFRRMIIITPNPALCAEFPSQVWIRAGATGPVVEYRGAGDSGREAGGYDHVAADGGVTPDFVGEVAQ